MSTKRNSKGQFVKGENIKDLTGKRFGRLEVVELANRRSGRKAYWLCKCDCGNFKEVRSDCLKVVSSCGCLKKEQDIINLGVENNHKLSKHELYSRWNAMINRCDNPNSPAFKNYGGRGIKVCEKWHDVKEFIEWAENNGYKEGLTIERKDVNGNYEPSNCCWIPPEEQHYNKTTSVFVEYEGETLTVMQWAKRYNIPRGEVWSYRTKGIDFKSLIEKYKTTPR